MSRHSPFRQADVTRALRGAQKAGAVVRRVEIEGQKIVVVCSEDAPAPPESPADGIERLRREHGWARS